jgi:uncharacterized protein YndB with AHSA1/START domain
MARIRVSTTIDAPPRKVWAAVEDIGTHADWMHDAVAIRFVSSRRAGAGTVFDCDTRIGPFRLTDRMTITSWKPGREMGVVHEGLVTGTGRFTMRCRRGGRTRFTWSERLVFPWHLGGPIAATLVAPVLRLIWRRSLRDLKSLVEGAG